MDQELTKEQKDQLVTWSGQRDAMLSEISNLELAREKIKEGNEGLTASYTDIHNEMNVIKGRVIELKKKEAELPLLISKEVAKLQASKTKLESETTHLKGMIVVLNNQKASIEKDVLFELSALKKLKEGTLDIEKIIGSVTKVGEVSVRNMDALVSGVSVSLERLVEINNENVSKTNIVLEKLPGMLMEVQKAQKPKLVVNKDVIKKIND